MSDPAHAIVTILPCRDLEASTAFYGLLGLAVSADYGTYRILEDGKGWHLHLSCEAPEGWLVPDRNPNGLYLYATEIDRLAKAMAGRIIGAGPELKPWGMVEFAVSDPDGTLVRIGCPEELLP